MSDEEVVSLRDDSDTAEAVIVFSHRVLTQLAKLGMPDKLFWAHIKMLHNRCWWPKEPELTELKLQIKYLELARMLRQDSSVLPSTSAPPIAHTSETPSLSSASDADTQRPIRASSEGFCDT